MALVSFSDLPKITQLKMIELVLDSTPSLFPLHLTFLTGRPSKKLLPWKRTVIEPLFEPCGLF